MKLVAYDAFCRSLPHAHMVVQWGGAHVWKVTTKVYAIGRVAENGALHVTYKCSPLAFEALRDAPDMRPAPYLASRGIRWLQWMGPATLSEPALRDALRESHRLVAAGLPKAVRRELGL